MAEAYQLTLFENDPDYDVPKYRLVQYGSVSGKLLTQRQVDQLLIRQSDGLIVRLIPDATWNTMSRQEQIQVANETLNRVTV